MGAVNPWQIMCTHVMHTHAHTCTHMHTMQFFIFTDDVVVPSNSTASTNGTDYIPLPGECCGVR